MIFQMSRVAPAYDSDTMAELEEMFGRDRLAELLAGLDKEIAARLDAPARERGQLGKDAHALVSVSGMLGFMPLSQACTDLEIVCLGDEDVTSALARTLAAAATARTEIVTLRGTLG